MGDLYAWRQHVLHQAGCQLFSLACCNVIHCVLAQLKPAELQLTYSVSEVSFVYFVFALLPLSALDLVVYCLLNKDTSIWHLLVGRKWGISCSDSVREVFLWQSGVRLICSMLTGWSTHGGSQLNPSACFPVCLPGASLPLSLTFSLSSRSP